MIEFYQDTCACYLDHGTARTRASILLPSSSVLPNLQINRRAISDWIRTRRSRGARMLSAVVVAATVACNSGLLSPAFAESGDVGDMAVTVARTTNICFSDTLQVTGVVVPRNENSCTAGPGRVADFASAGRAWRHRRVRAGVGPPYAAGGPAGRRNDRCHTSACRWRCDVEIRGCWNAGVGPGRAPVSNCREGRDGTVGRNTGQVTRHRRRQSDGENRDRGRR